MKVLHSIFSILLVVLVLAMGAGFLVIGFLGDMGWTWIQMTVGGPDRLFPLCTGVAIVFSAWLWMLTGRLGRSNSLITYDTEGGSVSIRTDAIREFLVRLGRSVPEVSSVRPVVRYQKGNLSVVMEVRIRTGSSVPDISRALQDKTHRGIEHDLGLSHVQKVQVVVTGIVGEPVASPSVKPPAFDRSEDLDFTGRSGLR